jgi:hypothetical protein
MTALDHHGKLGTHDLLAELTLEEKASLLDGGDFWRTRPVERLDIPGVMLTDGPHGLRKQTAATDHLGVSDSVPATCFPPAAGLLPAGTSTSSSAWARRSAPKRERRTWRCCSARAST